MGRIIAIDYGIKRTGLAVTDPLQLISTALKALETKDLLPFLKVYFQMEKVDKLVVGSPKKLNGEDSEIMPFVKQLMSTLGTTFPTVPVIPVDERFTSRIAQRATIEGQMKKKDRRKKGNIDKISAVLILQTYLDTQQRVDMRG